MDLDGFWRLAVAVDVAPFAVIVKLCNVQCACDVKREIQSKAADREEEGDIPGGGWAEAAARSRPTRIKVSRSRVCSLCTSPSLRVSSSSSSPSTFASPLPTFTMFARSAARQVSSVRQFSSSAARNTNVTVLGAGGGIGQPLSLLLKLDPHVKKLNLYDIRGAPGVAADVSHIDSASEVRVS